VSARYDDILDHGLGAMMSVDFATVRGEVVDYMVVLLLLSDDDVETIRVYDCAHGFNEMHRYTRAGGKQAGTVFLGATLGEGMRTAIGDIRVGYQAMIEGWRG
jgi:hypothetical protein